ncbi:MAG: hypothetical protein RPR97_13680 [Colwellia sp.]|jgi:hypothetical protein
MKLSNEKNKKEIPKADIKTINKAKSSQGDKLLNDVYLHQLESTNHYVLGYN